MTTVHPERALYEYRGSRPDPVLQAQRAQQPAVVWPPRSSDPALCSSCLAPAQRLATGWWCDSCQTATV